MPIWLPCLFSIGLPCHISTPLCHFTFGSARPIRFARTFQVSVTTRLSPASLAERERGTCTAGNDHVYPPPVAAFSGGREWKMPIDIECSPMLSSVWHNSDRPQGPWQHCMQVPSNTSKGPSRPCVAPPMAPEPPSSPVSLPVCQYDRLQFLYRGAFCDYLFLTRCSLSGLVCLYQLVKLL